MPCTQNIDEQNKVRVVFDLLGVSWEYLDDTHLSSTISEGWPEPEIGWVVFEGFEGRGIAREAAERVRRYAYEDLGLTTLTSNIVPGNTRSVALAERMGATYERTYMNYSMGEDMLYRHPGPEEVLG